MGDLLGLGMGFLPRVLSELRKSKEEHAMQAIAKHCNCSFQDVLDAFSPLDQSSILYANKENLIGSHREQFFRETQLSNFRIQYLALDPRLLKERKADIKALQKIMKHYRELLSAIKGFGSERWGEMLSYVQNADYDHLFNMYAIVVAECITREEAEKQRKKHRKAGRIPDERPVFLAKRLADLFLSRGRTEIKAGRRYDTQDTNGEFGVAVEETFKAFGLEHDFRRPADAAKDYAKNKLEKK